MSDSQAEPFFVHVTVDGVQYSLRVVYDDFIKLQQGNYFLFWDVTREIRLIAFKILMATDVGGDYPNIFMEHASEFIRKLPIEVKKDMMVKHPIAVSQQGECFRISEIVLDC